MKVDLDKQFRIDYALNRFDTFLFQQDLYDAAQSFLAMKSDDGFEIFSMALRKYSRFCLDLNILSGYTEEFHRLVKEYFNCAPNTSIERFDRKILNIISNLDRVVSEVREFPTQKLNISNLENEKNSLQNEMAYFSRKT